MHCRAVVIGKSGAGKSTFINMVGNLANGKNYRDKRIVAITQGFSFMAEDGKTHNFVLPCNIPQFMQVKTKDAMGEQPNSLTQRCNEYTFETDKYSLTLVDTPGIGDNRGGQDEINTTMIAEQVVMMGNFDAIILVHKGDDICNDLSVKSLLSELQSMMPKSFKSNLIVVFTHVTSTFIPGINHLQSKGIAVDNIITMDNGCYPPVPDIIARTRGGGEQLKSQLQLAETSWDKNKRQYSKLIEMLRTMKSRTTPLDNQKMIALRRNKKELSEHVLKIMDLHRQSIVLTTEAETQQKYLDCAQQMRKEGFEDMVRLLTPFVNASEKKLHRLSLMIQSRMKDIIRLHRRIVEESMLPPSDPLEARLHREIIELEKKANTGDKRAAVGLNNMQVLLNNYNQVKKYI